MIEPEIIQIEDYSKYIGREFVITQDCFDLKRTVGRPLLKGVRFKIKSFKNKSVKIKITNSEKELDFLKMLDYDFERVSSEILKSLNEVSKVVKLWEEESDKFEVDLNDFWNSDRGNGKGHCINTGYYNIPPNHPDKYGMAKARYSDGIYTNSDSIMTMNYKRNDNKRNTYSYQKGDNTFYSKDTYYYILMGYKLRLENWLTKDKKVKKEICKMIYNIKELSISSLKKLNLKNVTVNKLNE